MSTNKNSETLSYDIISKYRGVLMGISIIGILIFHFTDDCRIYHYNWDWAINRLFNRYISSSGVDVFLFLSGFGCYYSFKKKPDIQSFYKRRFLKIIIPYAIVAVPAWFWRDIIHSGAGLTTYFKDLFFVSFFNRHVTWYWYIFMILVCYLIFPYIFEVVDTAYDKITEHMRMVVVFCFFTMLAVCFSLYCPEFFGNVNIAWLRFPAFFFGCFVGKWSYENRQLSVAAVGGTLLSFFLLPLRNYNKIIIVRYVVAYFNISCCILFALVLEVLRRKEIGCTWFRKVVEWFGKYSLELYLTYVMIRGVMNILGYNTCRVRYEVIMLSLSILTSILLKKLTEVIIGLFSEKVRRTDMIK